MPKFGSNPKATLNKESVQESGSASWVAYYHERINRFHFPKRWIKQAIEKHAESDGQSQETNQNPGKNRTNPSAECSANCCVDLQRCAHAHVVFLIELFMLIFLYFPDWELTY